MGEDLPIEQYPLARYLGGSRLNWAKDWAMELGNLMLMCMNLVCVTGAGVVVILTMMHIQRRKRRRQMRVYDRPPDLKAWSSSVASQEEEP
jgi:hypothetical protein